MSARTPEVELVIHLNNLRNNSPQEPHIKTQPVIPDFELCEYYIRAMSHETSMSKQIKIKNVKDI